MLARTRNIIKWRLFPSECLCHLFGILWENIENFCLRTAIHSCIFIINYKHKRLLRGNIGYSKKCSFFSIRVSNTVGMAHNNAV